MTSRLFAVVIPMLLATACATSSGSNEAKVQQSPEVAKPAVVQAQATPCTEPNQCVQSIYARIIQHWQTPPNTDPKLSAVLQVSLQDDFSLDGVKVVKASGVPAFDQSIERAIQQAAPFSELKGLAGSQDLSNFRQFEIGFSPQPAKGADPAAAEKMNTAIQQLFGQSCKQVSRELNRFSAANRGKKGIEQSNLMVMTTGALVLSMQQQQLPEQQQQQILASLPTTYQQVQKDCAKQPKAVYKTVLFKRLKLQ